MPIFTKQITQSEWFALTERIYLGDVFVDVVTNQFIRDALVSFYNTGVLYVSQARLLSVKLRNR